MSKKMPTRMIKCFPTCMMSLKHVQQRKKPMNEWNLTCTRRGGLKCSIPEEAHLVGVSDAKALIPYFVPTMRCIQ